MTSKLEISHLYKVYGNRPDEAMALIDQDVHPSEILAKTEQVAAVLDVSFKVKEGEIFTIMGLSGSGKSTLVRCLNRLIEPTRGNVFIDGEDILNKSRAELREVRRTKISMVFQNFALLPHKTVLDNVQFGLSVRGESVDICRSKALEALAQVGLSDWAGHYPDNLSGGMKQRVGLARALASDPDILLMDEPFSALDPLIRDELQRELLKLQRDIKKTIVFITHDFLEAVKLSDHLAVMRDGRFVQVGTPQEIVLTPVDDYVRNFAKEMDRSRILTAGMLADTIDTVKIRSDSTVNQAEELMHIAGRRHGALIDDAGRMQALISADALFGAPRDDMAADHRSMPSCASRSIDCLLADLYPLFANRQPVAVCAEDGTHMALLEATDVLQMLSGIDGAEASETSVETTLNDIEKKALIS
ncbi:glycine betaine/L-proline ABC transporter ATP-binding protein [Roseovarius pelagicus]|uniref:Quaternary amine transport ATP-binding protein n=2 Tax=Roseovarius pelagicus TaxID=2980108 RepID=A0ABY6DD51_9RHOB|nr:glycine betaine/L-proline ABC transporter ATP-binding protein [Roseovarius pelagicus]